MTARQNKPQLPPTQSIDLDPSLRATTEKWFEYPITAYPHHTDYAGIVWHGSYLTWMEQARVEYLRALGIEYSELVNSGCDLPVIEINLRYHQAMRMGERAIVKTRMNNIEGVRIHWDYQIESFPNNFPEHRIYVSGRITLVTVDRDKGKIMRALPHMLKDALVKL